jgi:hypothetical protein
VQRYGLRFMTLQFLLGENGIYARYIPVPVW